MFGIETILIVVISVVLVILAKSLGLWWLWKKFRGPVIAEKIRLRQVAEAAQVAEATEAASPSTPIESSSLESQQADAKGESQSQDSKDSQSIPMLLSPELKARAKASRNPQDEE